MDNPGTYITKNEAAELLGITERELCLRCHEGRYTWRDFPSEFHRGKLVKKVLLESLPAEKQLCWAERPLPHNDLPQSPELPRYSAPHAAASSTALDLCRPAELLNAAVIPNDTAHITRRSPLAPARREFFIGMGSTEPQLPLNFDRKDAFRFLPPELGAWAWTWFERLVETGLLCLVDGDDVIRNGGWKKKFLGRELNAGGCTFLIKNKEDAARYVAAVHGVSVGFIWERCREFTEFFRYIIGQKRNGQPVDSAAVAAIFPRRSKDGGTFRKRRDAGVSKTIPEAAAEFFVARYGKGSRPGDDGWKPSLALIHNEYQTLRQALIDLGENPDPHGFPDVSIYALRRFMAKADRESDPGLVLAREGSAALRNRITPHIIREKSGMFVHDWWVSDHRLSNLWVRWSLNPEVVYRPWTTWLLDVRSMYPLSFVLTPIPSSLSIMRALKIGFLTHQTAPCIFYCDNGKDYKAIALQGTAKFPYPMEGNDGFDERQLGMLRRFEIEPRHALPSRRSKSTGETECHARSKPVEAWFGQWLNEFDRQQDGACGMNPQERPDKNGPELAHPEKLMLDTDYEELLAGYVRDRIAHNPSRGLNGLSPAQAFDRFARRNWELDERTLLPEQIGYLMLTPPDPRRVRNSMVQVKIAGEERFYQHSAFFAGLNGQDVEVRYDPTDPETVDIFKDGRYLGPAHQVRKLPWGAASELVSEGMQIQRVATRAAKDLIDRRAAAAGPLPSQREMGQIRALLVSKHLVPAEVAHAASIERVKTTPTRAKAKAASAWMPTSEETAERALALETEGEK